MQPKPDSKRPAKIQCGDCFYNDGKCEADPEKCCYLKKENKCDSKDFKYEQLKEEK
jgi:hypothetical protein